MSHFDSCTHADVRSYVAPDDFETNYVKTATDASLGIGALVIRSKEDDDPN